MEPESCPVLSGGKPGPHMIQGIGAGFVPAVLDVDLYDEIIPVKNEEAIETAREIGRTEGILVGFRRGSCPCGRASGFFRSEMEGKNIVVILPDNGDRYLSTPVFED